MYLKIRPYKQQTLENRRCEKMSPTFFGRYQNMAHVGEVAYLLDLLESAHIHPFFHTSQLKKAIVEKHVIQQDISLLNDQMEWILELKKVT